MAQLLSGHTAVVWIEGCSGAVGLTHVEPVKSLPFTYHHDDKLGCQVHDGCGGPIIGTRWSMFCLRCRPDLTFGEDGGPNRFMIRWLRDNDMLDAVLIEPEA